MVKFVESSADSAWYASPREAVGDGGKLSWLQQAWSEGIDSGDYRLLDIEAIKAEGRKRFAVKA